MMNVPFTNVFTGIESIGGFLFPSTQISDGVCESFSTERFMPYKLACKIFNRSMVEVGTIAIPTDNAFFII